MDAGVRGRVPSNETRSRTIGCQDGYRDLACLTPMGRRQIIQRYETAASRGQGLNLRPYIGKRRLDQLQPEHPEKAYKKLLDKGLSPATVLRVHRMLHRALKIAMQRERGARNVATLVEQPQQERPKTPQPLDVDECKRVLTAAEGLQNAARWTVDLA